jgi:hypothetical protein
LWSESEAAAKERRTRSARAASAAPPAVAIGEGNGRPARGRCLCSFFSRFPRVFGLWRRKRGTAACMAGQSRRFLREEGSIRQAVQCSRADYSTQSDLPCPCLIPLISGQSEAEIFFPPQPNKGLVIFNLLSIYLHHFISFCFGTN